MFVYPYPWLTCYVECDTQIHIEDSSFFSLAVPQTNGWYNTVIDVSDFYPLDKLLNNLWQNMIKIN